MKDAHETHPPSRADLEYGASGSEASADRLSTEQLRRIAEHISTWTYQHLISTTSIDRLTAMEASCQAANRFCQVLLLTINEAEGRVKLPTCSGSRRAQDGGKV